MYQHDDKQTMMKARTRVFPTRPLA